jgi:hypothetical protein
MFSLFSQRQTQTSHPQVHRTVARPHPTTQFTQRATQPSRQTKFAAAWQAVGHARFFFIDRQRAPVPLPACLLDGSFTTPNGTPCRRAVVDGFGVAADIVIDHVTGLPRVIWVHNGHPNQFKVIL